MVSELSENPTISDREIFMDVSLSLVWPHVYVKGSGQAAQSTVVDLETDWRLFVRVCGAQYRPAFTV